MSKIIAFTGFKQTGKSTAAKYLESKGYVRHNFKDALVQELKDGFPDLLREIDSQWKKDLIRGGATYDVLDWDLFDKKPPLMRALMQNYGTDVRRKEDPDYWVKQWAKNSYGHDKIVCDDVRFINEAAKVKERGGIIIRLTRPDITSGGEHSSETEQLQIEVDYTIECVPGDHEHLYRELDKIVDN